MSLLSKNSERLIAEFYREYLDDPDFELPRVIFGTGQIARAAATILKIHGITIGPLVLIAPRLLESMDGKRKLPRDLVVHEIAHVVQYRRHGFFGFLWIYFGDYLRNLRERGSWSAKSRHAAYLAIPFEIEARQTAFDFELWFEERREK